MTISKLDSALLFTVVGSTGTQGRSVVHAIKASTKPYRVRAITRDIGKPMAKELEALGCELVRADISTAEGCRRAFEGADVVYAMTATDFTVENFKQKELEEGKAQFDAANAAGVKVFIWSGASNLGELSGGECPADPFDVRAEVMAYARRIGGMKIIDVQPGSYGINFVTGIFSPRKQDGPLTLTLPFEPTTKIPIIDMDTDYGNYVVAALENDGPETIRAAAEYVTPSQVAEWQSKVLGKAVSFTQIPDEQFFEALEKRTNKRVATVFTSIARAFRQIGYYDSPDLDESNSIVSPPARTLQQVLEANKEVFVNRYI